MNFLKNWKTTLSGLLTLGAIGVAAAHDPSILTNTQTVASIISGFGLLVAADSTGNKPAAQ